MNRIHRNYRIARYIIYRQTLVSPQDHLWAFIGAFIGIGLIGFSHELLSSFSISDKVFLIGSFGASAVLVYGVTNSPLSQPRNLIGGHVISAIIGVSVFKSLNSLQMPWLNSALAVSLSIVAMQYTKTLHPPGGATALIANLGSVKIQGLGFLYVLYPVLTGAVILFVIAIVINNIPRGRSYPYNKTLKATFKNLLYENNRNNRRLGTRSHH